MLTLITSSLVGAATHSPPAKAAPRAAGFLTYKLSTQVPVLHTPSLVICDIRATGFGELLVAVLKQVYSILYCQRANTVTSSLSSQL